VDAEALAVALIPWYIANRDAVERSRSMLRIWAGGVRSLHGKYAELLARLGAEVRVYRTVVDGRQYKRYLVVIRGRLYEDVFRVLRDKKKLRRAARRHFDLLVEAFRYYSLRLGRREAEELEELRQTMHVAEWRSLVRERIRGELEDLLGPLLARRLLEALRAVLASRRGPRHEYTRKWLRVLYGRGRGYGFLKKLMGCVEEYIDWTGGNVDEAKKRCIAKIVGGKRRG